MRARRRCAAAPRAKSVGNTSVMSEVTLAFPTLFTRGLSAGCAGRRAALLRDDFAGFAGFAFNRRRAGVARYGTSFTISAPAVRLPRVSADTLCR
jgi:hypothetical protein